MLSHPLEQIQHLVPNLCWFNVNRAPKTIHNTLQEPGDFSSIQEELKSGRHLSEVFVWRREILFKISQDYKAQDKKEK